MEKRFTIDGSRELEERLESLCQAALEEVRRVIPEDKLEALLLGGGYGRGEGGVLRTPTGDQPYNDLEFYVCLGGNTFLNERKYGHSLHETAERLTERAGIEVEFKITSAEKLRSSPPTMFFYDLISGHRLLWGNRAILVGCEHHSDPEKIPLAEATRLLMNRCSGLLFAEERLQRPEFTSVEADFVGRNQAKAQLAFGDVLLTIHGQYHWNVQERNRRLAKLAPKEPLPWLNQVRHHHLIGVDFKLHPKKLNLNVAEFRARQEELRELGGKLWLHLESLRLGRSYPDFRQYALCRKNKCPETSSSRNWLVNLKTFGPSVVLDPRSPRYPRERLFNTLVVLLWHPQGLNDPECLQHLQEELQTEAADFKGLVAAYEQLWRRFN